MVALKYVASGDESGGLENRYALTGIQSSPVGTPSGESLPDPDVKLSEAEVFVAYIFRSLKDASYYYGHTEDINARLIIHNKDRERYTKGHLPYLVHYTEEFATRKEAAARERFFKSIDGYNWLRSEGIIK